MNNIYSITPTNKGIKVKMYPKDVYWMDIWTGEIVTYREMIEILENEYDFDDFTPMNEIFEYFEPTNVKVK